MWKLCNRLFKKKSKGQRKIFFKSKESKSFIRRSKYLEIKHKTQNLWDVAKAMLGKKCGAIKSHIKKKKKSFQVNNLNLHLKEL